MHLWVFACACADLLQNGLVGSPCSPRDSQESSPTPQSKSISSQKLEKRSHPLEYPKQKMGKWVENRLTLHIIQGFPRWLSDIKNMLANAGDGRFNPWPSAFFIVQLSHPYMTTGKTIALAQQIFVGKVMPLLFNMLSRLVITFLPRSKSLLISWLQSPSAVILEPKKMKIITFRLITLLQIYGETMETVRDFIIRGCKITADDDCSHEIERCLLVWRKVMTRLAAF